ncbi:PBP1A family penicillin-binding protein [Planococcus sp. N028]|uniref:PBP1A family penicillin-binding protein n=1 Tax=Planococcus shixiaomingii TaxID=3058393 RepID=A0ABT8MZL3_9BACL|nr:penicillin-binding protein 1A [Planococcus sp. N028]MDN7241079.1 PBP1A family penicillin-binding protein [Planococcus sp. N028]
MSEKPVSREQRRKAIEQQKKKSNKKEKKTGGSWFKRIFMAVVLIGLIGFICGAGLFAYYASSAPEIDEELLRDPISPTFIAADGKTEIPYMTAENRTYVNYEDIPKVLEDAILATEDNRFYKHSGIDVIRLGGAVIANITGGFGSQGASTITQQVIKNSFLSNDKTLKRKAQEAYLAFQLERKYEKEEIFEMYFNKILMSGNIYGFGTAAEYFYGKPLAELELHEAATLAGMPQSPNGYNPFKNPDRAETRRNVVLSLMEQHGKITKEEKEAAQAIPLEDSLLKKEDRKQTAATGEFTAFMEMVEDEIESLDGDISLDEGLTIYTTLDPTVQKAVNKAMASDLFFDEEVESAMTIVDTKTGGIRAIGAGRDYSGDVRRNYAISRDRVIGSTIKPLIDYGPAIEKMNWSTGQTVVDEPYSYEGGQEIRNVDGEFLGPMTIREALYRSRNIPAVKTLQEVGFKEASKFAKRLGLDFGNVYESAALGSPEKNISTVEMAGAFAAFGNSGEFTEPHTVTKIVFRDGTTEQVVQPEPVQAMKDSTAYMVTDMLRDAVDPNLPGATGKEAAISGLDLAGKTGTSNYDADEYSKYNLDASSAPDVWFAGYTTDYSVSVWSGYPSRKYAIDTASNERLLAQRLFKQVMSDISSSDTAGFKKPESVVEKTIELGSTPLKLASPFTPLYLRKTELFVRGEEPQQVSEKFIQKDLAVPSGLRANVEGNSVNLSWSYSGSQDVAFEVAVNGSTLTTTGDTGYTFNGLEPGTSYTFTVIAFTDDQHSKPASVTVEVAAVEEEPVEEEPVEEEPVEEEPVEEEPVEEEPAEEEPAEEEPAEEEPAEEEPAEEEPAEEEPAEEEPAEEEPAKEEKSEKKDDSASRSGQSENPDENKGNGKQGNENQEKGNGNGNQGKGNGNGNGNENSGNGNGN